MIKIGDFSKLSQVSIKALRYYDEMGLLKPINIDQETGYRSYAVDQLSRLNRIRALKDLGLSLQQIGQVLNEGLSAEQLRGMLRLKRAELQQHIADEQERLARVEFRLNEIETENAMPNYDVVLKQVDNQLVAGMREKLASYPEIGRLFETINRSLAHAGIDASALIGCAIWHDPEYKVSDIDGEAVVYLKGPLPTPALLNVYQLPGGTMASVIHKGAYNRFCYAYEALVRWIEANNYTIAGPNREIYLECTQPVRQDDESYVTEIQFPVARRG